ncbi:MAG: hypothetical protein K0S74_1276 [Chlamydiales bacterium]|jgi:hypothetical protein|nr:hypothetical protein [Chlamydiales bacterium]
MFCMASLLEILLTKNKQAHLKINNYKYTNRKDYDFI